MEFYLEIFSLNSLVSSNLKIAPTWPTWHCVHITILGNSVQLHVLYHSPEDMVWGRSLIMAVAARSNWSVSWRFGQVAVVLGKVPVVLLLPPAGYGVDGVLELLLLCSDMLDTCWHMATLSVHVTDCKKRRHSVVKQVMLITESAQQCCHIVAEILDCIMSNSSFQETGFEVSFNCSLNMTWNLEQSTFWNLKLASTVNIRKYVKMVQNNTENLNISIFHFWPESGGKTLQYSGSNMYSCLI
jgi:hypothetical protein